MYVIRLTCVTIPTGILVNTLTLTRYGLPTQHRNTIRLPYADVLIGGVEVSYSSPRTTLSETLMSIWALL